MHLAIPHIAAIGRRWLLPLILMVAFFAALRIPVVGTVLRVGLTLALVGILVAVVVERERVDPYLRQIATALQLDDQEVVGKELRVQMSPDGHFWVRARIDGVERRLLIDSGATVTAVSGETAAAARLYRRKGLFPILVNTANGTIPAETATIDELRLGNIVARRLEVIVVPSGNDMDVLGMNFLSQLKSWRVEGKTMVLVPHHPQLGGSASAASSGALGS
jgi:aspartyl protease family protein